MSTTGVVKTLFGVVLKTGGFFRYSARSARSVGVDDECGKVPLRSGAGDGGVLPVLSKVRRKPKVV